MMAVQSASSDGDRTRPARRRRATVVGAGVSGLTAAKVLAGRGFEVTLFERAAVLGGVWTTAYRNVRLQQHKADFRLAGHEWPAGTADFPGKLAVLRYLHEFASESRLTERIRFRATVTDACFDAKRGLWTLQVTHEAPATDGVEKPAATSRFEHECEYVVVACGSLGPARRALASRLASEGFAGTLMHSVDYDAPGPQLDGKRVLVVGGSSSGVEVAVDLARCASDVTLLLRPDSAQWVFPRHGLLGAPLRLCGAAALWEPLWLRNLRARALFALRFGATLDRFGIRPSHAPYSGKIIASDEFVTYLQHGVVKLARSGDVHATKRGTLLLDDGQELAADVVVTCTGFQPPSATTTLSFLQRYLPREEGLSHLYRTVFHPDVPNAAFVGYAYGFVAIPAVAELQALAAANVFTGSVVLPPAEEQRRQAAAEAAANGWGTTLWLTDNRAYRRLQALAHPADRTRWVLPVWGMGLAGAIAFTYCLCHRVSR